ncbi:hypothetical protein I5677_14555 [Mobilitalea sibirica]|uniref:Uncharacterized protein n=1 Tax=Mobilitalea sibirica TaxID=1462919 RepID=A0A8J7H4A9_9FIRM|nr:hypothetical protein [Mobilitalea sibirica]MBH1942120.1 hypothetical protein [Mobilitalea sibirica]
MKSILKKFKSRVISQRGYYFKYSRKRMSINCKSNKKRSVYKDRLALDDNWKSEDKRNNGLTFQCVLINSLYKNKNT